MLRRRGQQQQTDEDNHRREEDAEQEGPEIADLGPPSAIGDKEAKHDINDGRNRDHFLNLRRLPTIRARLHDSGPQTPIDLPIARCLENVSANDHSRRAIG